MRRVRVPEVRRGAILGPRGRARTAARETDVQNAEQTGFGGHYSVLNVTLGPAEEPPAGSGSPPAEAAVQVPARLAERQQQEIRGGGFPEQPS